LLAIGQVARLSGLTVSALRFYDTAGVLIPAVVDERSGYRWYGRAQVDDARVVARLRRVGMPLPEIGRVLALRPRPAEAVAILDDHLQRLEDGLADARHELSAARELLELRETEMTEPTWMTMAGADLAAELVAVRFAAGTDLDLPALCGVLLDLDPGDRVLRVVATDRYRMAVSAVAGVESRGPAAQAAAPSKFIDDAIALLHDHPGQIRLTLDGELITVELIIVEAGQSRLSHPALAGVFPEYRRLIPARRADPVPVDVACLRAEIEATPPRTRIREQDGERYDLTVLILDADGVLSVVSDPEADLRPGSGPGTVIGVNREFLLQALNAGTGGQLLLELDGPIAPLALRDPRRADYLSLLMPTRLAPVS
jgi:DNA-binding transcriptional MerR regulator